MRRARDRREGRRGSGDTAVWELPGGRRTPPGVTSCHGREGASGGGEILLTSMDRDGTSDGYDD